jgi:hypothetical protein
MAKRASFLRDGGGIIAEKGEAAPVVSDNKKNKIGVKEISESQTKLTFFLPVRVHSRFKKAATLDETTMANLLRGWIDEYLSAR